MPRRNRFHVMSMRKDSRYQVQYVALNNIYAYMGYLSRKTAYELSKSLNDLDKTYYKKLGKLNKMRNKALNERTNYLKSINPNFEGTMRIPKTLGACADLLYTLRARRLAAEKKVKDAREKETLLADHIINLLPKSQLTGVAGKIARATITKREFAKAYDWDALYKHIAETGSFDLLERRISRGAARARWLQEEDIPGVEKFVEVGVHISKLGGFIMAWDDDEIDYSCFEDDDYKKGDNYYDDDDWGRAAARYEDIKHIEATQRRGWLTNY